MRVIEKIGVVVFVLALLLPAAGLADHITPPPSFESWRLTRGVGVEGHDFGGLGSFVIATMIPLLLLAVLLAIRPITRLLLTGKTTDNMGLTVLIAILIVCATAVSMIIGLKICRMQKQEQIVLPDKPTSEERKDYEAFCQEWSRKEAEELSRHVRRCGRCGTIIYRSSGGHCECQVEHIHEATQNELHGDIHDRETM